MYAVIDIGSNTIRLVLYKYEGGKIKKIFSKKETVGLAGYVSLDHKLSTEGQNKLLNTLKSFEAILTTMKIKEIITFATASLRNVANCDSIVRNIKIHTDLNIRVLSGEEEGTYGYIGAFQNVGLKKGLLIDVGGGSTEMVFFNKKKINKVVSLPIGSLNLYKTYVSDILPSHFEMRNIKNAVKGELNKIYHPSLDLDSPTICAIGGSARVALKMYNHENKELSDSLSFPSSFFKKEKNLLEENREAFINTLLKVAPERVHTAMPGIIIMNTLAKYFRCEKIIVSNYGVREGVLADYLKEEINNHE